MIAAFQAHLIFPTHLVGPPGPLPPGALRLRLETPDGNTLHGVHIPPVAPAATPRTLVLGFGGNGWNGADVATQLHHAFPHRDVIAFHYRGYRPSTGSPSAEALLADAPLVHRFAVDRVRPERTVAVGFSIGSGVAASLAGGPDLDGLILVTPFDSLKRAAADLYPWLPVGTFFAHEIDTLAFLSDRDVPVAILAAADDSLIRPERTQALRQGLRTLVHDQTIAGAGHNDLYHRPEFATANRVALDRLLAVSSRR